MNLSPLFISIKISVISIIFVFFIGVIVAYKMFFYKGKLKIFIDSFINISLVLPPTVIGFILLVIFGRYGIGGKFLNIFGINIIFTWQAAVIASFFVSFPLMYRSIISSLYLIDKSLFEVAQTMGASKIELLLYVIIPLAKPGIISGSILAFMRSLGEFGATLMVAGNIPGKTQTISEAIYFYASSGDMRSAFIWVMGLVVFSFLFMILVSNLEKK